VCRVYFHEGIAPNAYVNFGLFHRCKIPTAQYYMLVDRKIPITSIFTT